MFLKSPSLSLTSAKITELSDIDSLQSRAIDLLRFPMAVFVVFIHMSPPTIPPLDADFPLLSEQGIYNLLAVIVSHVISQVAVPVFFLISGFLFFRNFNEWSWQKYGKKMKSRFRSMLLPYILWNLAVILLFIAFYALHFILKDHSGLLLKEYLSSLNWHIFYDCHSWGQERTDWFGNHLLSTSSIIVPLWFLRDLIVVSVFSPAIFLAVKRFGLSIIAILFLCYVSRVWTIIPGLSITAFFYFSLGAYFSIRHINLIDWTCKRKNVILSLTLILLPFCILFDGMFTPTGRNIMPFFVCSGVFATFIIISHLIRKYGWQPNRLLVSACFFIYALHFFVFPLFGAPIKFVRQTLVNYCFDLPFGNLISYMLSPLITIAFCIAVYMLMKRCTPAIARLLSGNR